MWLSIIGSSAGSDAGSDAGAVAKSDKLSVNSYN
tara:strand:- start:905 stop:1006 length:102 start_codon:yes stop_codon:yes gene_type:complete